MTGEDHFIASTLVGIKDALVEGLDGLDKNLAALHQVTVGEFKALRERGRSPVSEVGEAMLRGRLHGLEIRQENLERATHDRLRGFEKSLKAIDHRLEALENSRNREQKVEVPEREEVTP